MRVLLVLAVLAFAACSGEVIEPTPEPTPAVEFVPPGPIPRHMPGGMTHWDVVAYGCLECGPPSSLERGAHSGICAIYGPAGCNFSVNSAYGAEAPE